MSHWHRRYGRCLGTLVILPAWLLASQESQSLRCATVITTLVTQLVASKPLTQLPRVEIRSCGPEEVLQLWAWEANAARPSLVVDTTDFTLVQTAARDNVYVVETTGGPRNRVFVIVYRDRKPTLALQRVTKGTAEVYLGPRYVDVTVVGIWAGDVGERSEFHRFWLE